MSDVTIKDFLESPPSDISILIGNGLGKSHPEYSHSFEFDPDYVFRKLLGEFATNYFDLKSFGLRKELISNYNCPEKFFQAFRVEMLFISLMYYIDNLHNLKNGRIKSNNLRGFLKRFKSIFTVNYDPIIYWNIFEQNNITNFTDGFCLNVAIPVSEEHNKQTIYQRISTEEKKGKIPIYYLHGAFHIFENNEKKYSKLKYGSNKPLLNQSKNKFEKILDEFRLYSGHSSEQPTCVMASNHNFKRAWIKEDPYLNYCFKQLRKVKKLLVFGCSFKNDGHLIDIFKNQELEKLWVCYKDDKHKASLKEIFKDYAEVESKITWIDSSDIQEIIWKN
jgi:hypothetical protein